jgi:hypothetical protein
MDDRAGRFACLRTGWSNSGSPNGAPAKPQAKENVLKPWQRQQWCIPKVGAAFVACMGDILDLYAEPYDAAHPVVCFDEAPVQLIGERVPRSRCFRGRRGEDYDYVCTGHATSSSWLNPSHPPKPVASSASSNPLHTKTR